MAFEPVELVRRIASLIPPRLRHLITYFGRASAHAKLPPGLSPWSRLRHQSRPSHPLHHLYRRR